MESIQNNGIMSQMLTSHFFGTFLTNDSSRRGTNKRRGKCLGDKWFFMLFQLNDEITICLMFTVYKWNFRRNAIFSTWWWPLFILYLRYRMSSILLLVMLCLTNNEEQQINRNVCAREKWFFEWNTYVHPVGIQYVTRYDKVGSLLLRRCWSQCFFFHMKKRVFFFFPHNIIRITDINERIFLICFQFRCLGFFLVHHNHSEENENSKSEDP